MTTSRAPQRARWFLPLVLLLTCLILFSHWIPKSFEWLKANDSGVFIYMGQRITRGEVLYIDVWDNKPPLLHYFNALGLVLAGGSAAGVFALCLLGTLFTMAVIWQLLKQWIEPAIAALGLSFFLLAYQRLVDTPNLTEVWSLPFQALGLLFIVRCLQGRAGPFTMAFVCGIATGVALQLRPNNIGIGVATFLCLPAIVGLDRRRMLLGLAGLAAGFAIVTAIVFGLMASGGAVRQYVGAVFLEGSRYSGEKTLRNRLSGEWAGIKLLMQSPLLPMTMLSLAMTAAAWRRAIRELPLRLMGFLLVWFLIEAVFSSVSGYGWDHYFVMWLVPLTMMFGLTAGFLLSTVSEDQTRFWLRYSCVVATLVCCAWVSYRGWQRTRQAMDNTAPDYGLALVNRYVKPAQSLTTWGPVQRDLWFNADRRAGAALFHPAGYTAEKVYRRIVGYFLDDVDRRKPDAILEKHNILPLLAESNPEVPLADFLQPPSYFAHWDTPEILARKRALAARYRAVAEDHGYTLFLRTD